MLCGDCDYRLHRLLSCHNRQIMRDTYFQDLKESTFVSQNENGGNIFTEGNVQETLISYMPMLFLVSYCWFYWFFFIFRVCLFLCAFFPISIWWKLGWVAVLKCIRRANSRSWQSSPKVERFHGESECFSVGGVFHEFLQKGGIFERRSPWVFQKRGLFSMIYLWYSITCDKCKDMAWQWHAYSKYRQSKTQINLKVTRHLCFKKSKKLRSGLWFS